MLLPLDGSIAVQTIVAVIERRKLDDLVTRRRDRQLRRRVRYFDLHLPKFRQLANFGV